MTNTTVQELSDFARAMTRGQTPVNKSVILSLSRSPPPPPPPPPQYLFLYVNWSRNPDNGITLRWASLNRRAYITFISSSVFLTGSGIGGSPSSCVGICSALHLGKQFHTKVSWVLVNQCLGKTTAKINSQSYLASLYPPSHI